MGTLAWMGVAEGVREGEMDGLLLTLTTEIGDAEQAGDNAAIVQLPNDG